MRTSTARLLAVCLVTTFLIQPTHAQQKADPKPAVSPVGKWSMSVDSPHGLVVVSLDLKVDGNQITGTMASDVTGEAGLTGTLSGTTVTLDVTSLDLEFHFTIKDQDTMTGRISGHMGDFDCTATRSKDKL